MENKSFCTVGPTINKSFKEYPEDVLEEALKSTLSLVVELESFLKH